MNSPVDNIFTNLPDNGAEEQFVDLLKRDGIRIERIVSNGHTAPAEGWFDQRENEWVIVLAGFGVIEFECGRTVTLTTGEHLLIQAHEKHKVTKTSPVEPTIWLAVFYP